MPEKILTADFHTHTTASTDGYSSVLENIEAARRKQLDALAITDHNTTAGLLGLNRRLIEELEDLELIEGVELTLTTGHYLLLGISPEKMQRQMEVWGIIPETEGYYFVVEDVKQEIDYLQWAIDQGAVVIAAHPGVPGKQSTTPDRLFTYHQKGLIHGAESDNGRAAISHNSLVYTGWHTYLVGLLRLLNIPAYANSDAHFAAHVGNRSNKITIPANDTLLEAMREKRVKIKHQK